MIDCRRTRQSCFLRYSTADPVRTKMKIIRITCISCAALLVSANALAERLRPSDLTYIGAFRVPETDNFAGMGAMDSPSSLSFRPDGDPGGAGDGHGGSLFLSRNETVSEITIPAPIKTTNVGALNVARQIQSRGNIIGNSSMGENDRFGGVAYVSARPGLPEPKIYWSTFEYYNVDGTDYNSVGVADVNLTNGRGQWHVGPAAGSNWDSPYHGQKHGEYLIPIDQAWADQYTGGRSLLVGRFREAGAAGGSMGPVLIAIAPWLDGNPPATGTRLSAVPLMAFKSSGGDGRSNSWMDFKITNDPDYPYYSAGDHWRGGAWISRGSKKAIVIVGRHGTYDGDPACPKRADGNGCGGAVGTDTPPYCYGGAADCPGIAVNDNKGYHSGPYKPRILFVDPDELAEVAQGKRAPNAVGAYDAYDPTSDWPWRDTDRLNDIAGAAYDPDGGYLYVAQANAYRPGGSVSTPWPVIHVYKVSGTAPPKPAAPTNLTVQ
jgi:hypothetical protein